MNPRVSVIVPIYNVEQYIGECIDSLLAQDYTDFEVICVDSGSSDNSFKVAQQTAADDPRFVFIQGRDAGQSVARNMALEVARGYYVLNLDSDDYYRPDTLGKLVAKADADNLDLLFFSAITFYEKSKLARTNPEKQDNRQSIPGILNGPEMYIQMERTESFRPSACLYLMRRDLIESLNLRFEEGIIHEDLLFTMLIVPHAQRCAFLNDTFYQRRMRPGSTMTTARGVRNIHGHLVASMRMESWLNANATRFSNEFCDAYCGRITFTWRLIADDVRKVDAKEIESLRDSLSREERIALNLHGIFLAGMLGELYDSTTYKVGRILLAAPTALKDRLKG